MGLKKWLFAKNCVSKSPYNGPYSKLGSLQCWKLWKVVASSYPPRMDNFGEICFFLIERCHLSACSETWQKLSLFMREDAFAAGLELEN